MRNVTSDKIVNVTVMDPIVRNVLGDATVGMSAGPNGSIIHLVDGSAQNVAIAEAAFEGYWALQVNADKETIQADNTDTVTITCNDPQLANLTHVQYYVLFDGLQYAMGQAELVNGGITLELASDTPGDFIVIIWSDVNYKSGAVIVRCLDGN